MSFAGFVNSLPRPIANLVFYSLYIPVVLFQQFLLMLGRCLIRLHLGWLLSKLEYWLLSLIHPNLVYRGDVSFDLADVVWAVLTYKKYGRLDGYCGEPYWKIADFLGPPYNTSFDKYRRP